MTAEPPPTRTITRRNLAKGVAWAAPAVTLAMAAPQAAASPTNPGCGCLSAGIVNTFTAQAVTALNLGVVTGTAVFNLDSSACDVGFFKPAYTVLGVGGSLSWATNQPASNFTVGVVTGVGTIGQISAFTFPFAVIGSIPMPNDLLPPYGPRIPGRICVTFTAIFIPILPIPQIECTYQFCADVSSPASTGVVIAGTGTVNWTDLTLSNATLTPLS